jgi:5-methylcytosine-specific restriction protein A
MNRKNDQYFILDPANTDTKRIKQERDKARELKKTSWWKEKLSKGVCHHCGERFLAKDLTMDHLVPLARGGLSTKNNLVPSCKPCNAGKRLSTPVDLLLEQIRSGSGEGSDSEE